MKCYNVWVQSRLFPPSHAPAYQQWGSRVQISYYIRPYQHQEGDAKWFFSSVSQSCPTLCNPMDCSTPGFPVHQQLQSLLKLMSIKSVMPSNHLILCCPLLLLPSIFPSIRVFSNESVLHIRWPKYWGFSFSVSPLNEYPGLISFQID